MPKSLSKTPAPKKDRIVGSSKNPKGSAASKKSGAKIELSESITKTLENKRDEYNEKHPNGKVNLATLKSVFRRGAGAFSTSYRPTISGGRPNSRSAWAFARVNKFLLKKGGTKVKAAYVQDDDLMAKGGQTGQAITCVNCGWHWNTADSDEFDKYVCHKCGFDNRTFYSPDPIGVLADGGLIAPNGKTSNLTPEQYKLVRTPQFKSWFGDWENDPENASKVVDENGEPLLVYHGTSTNFNEFIIGSSRGIFFSNKFSSAKLFSEGQFKRSGTKPHVKQCFLYSIKPFYKNFTKDIPLEKEYYETYFNERPFISEKSRKSILKKDNFNKEIVFFGIVDEDKKQIILKYSYDSIIIDADNDSKSYIVFSSSQVKLADGTNTTFDASNPDIRYADGGATDYGKVVSASSRFRPMETIVFDPPLVGLNGAKLISYTWSFEFETSFSKREGEAISVRKSDWTNAEISAETGRDIVHKYTIEMPNGDLKVVSSDSVPVLLGYTERAQKSSFPNLSNAAKTLAKQKLQLSILEAKKKEKDDAINEIIAKGIPEVRVEEGGLRGYRFIVGDSVCLGDDPNDKERLECPKDGYIINRLKEMGIDPYGNYSTYELKNRIERQERKIKEILNTKTPAEMGLELFKPSKTIEQIAKEKDVPLDYAEEQLRKGIKTESEHSDNLMVQETIALQHLDEMIDYYEKLEYMENQNKMEKGGVTQFYKEYLSWYKDGVFEDMTIMVSVPNALSKMSHGENDLILDVFEKKDENVDAKKKLTELLEIVDRNGLDVYLEPIPRLYNMKDKAKREKITREYLIKYYEKFGFELLSNGFMVRKHNKMEKGGYYKAGGEINPDNKAVKDYFSHGSGNVGGVLVGKRHSEGGIKAVNKSTNQPLEMEGGEVVITRNAVSDNTKREFNGEMLTNREILSKINESGGGVSFAKGGDIPETISTSGKEYKYGGKMMKDHEIVSSCGCNHSMAEGGETDYHTEIKNHLFPKIEIEVEVEVEPEMDVMPIHEHYITADDLGLSEGMPMLAVGTIVYSSGGNDQWEVVSFSDEGVNLVNKPKSPLQSKMEDKHLTFDELMKYYKDKSISIKNISTERELEPAIALVKSKLPQNSFALGGFIDGDEDEDAKIMQQQFGKSNFK